MIRYKIFTVLNILFISVVAGVIISSVIFLLIKINAAFNPNLITKPETASFNLSDAEKLQIIR